MNMKLELSENPCEKCGAQAEEVINTEENLRVGWYCLKCHNFEKAIARERVWRASDEN